MTATGRKEDPPGEKGSNGKELLQLFISGKREAFTELYNLYSASLLTYGLGMGFDRETLRDVIQDVFSKLFTDRKTLSGIKDIKPYLYRSLKNRLLNRVRDTGKLTPLDEKGTGFSITVTVMDEMIEKEDRNEVEQRINDYLRSLTDRQREAVFLRFMENMDYDQIGALLDITPHAARKLVSRAITTIRDNKLIMFLLLNGAVIPSPDMLSGIA